MKLIPARYRNILNPWQTKRELRSQIKTLDKILKKLTDDERAPLTRELEPDRDWRV